MTTPEPQMFSITVYDDSGVVVLFRRVQAPSGPGAITQLSEQMSVGNDNYGMTTGTAPTFIPASGKRQAACGHGDRGDGHCNWYATCTNGKKPEEETP